MRMEHIQALFLLCPFVFLHATVTYGQDQVCSRPEVPANVDMGGIQRYFNPGAELLLSCKQGYSPVLGPRTIVCAASGKWTKTRLMCKPIQCPYPDPPSNGEVYYEDTVYQSTINYMCNKGYFLIGNNTAVCQANGIWSTEEPECKSVTCSPAPIPDFGMIIYDRRIEGTDINYGVAVTYKCLPPYIVVGNARAECTEDGTWTKVPECQVVTCPPPQNISKGYKSNNFQEEYDFMEIIRYGCEIDYTLEGNMEVVCQQDGQWSKTPSCKAPCSVNIPRGRILYKGQKLWIEDLKPNKVLHKEIVSFYCMNQENGCGYAVPAQCMDGNLKTPGCFEEPSLLDYKHRGNLSSEIQQC